MTVDRAALFFLVQSFYAPLRSAVVVNGEVLLTVSTLNLPVFVRILRDSWSRFRSLTDLWATDRPSRCRRFQLGYLLLSYDRNLRVRLRVDLEQINSSSVVSLYPSAQWLEREVWDLFGVVFVGHSDLRRLLTDYGFEGHPLRKDFPLVGFLEARYDDLSKRVVLEPVELTQEYRHFDFTLPWSYDRCRI